MAVIRKVKTLQWVALIMIMTAGLVLGALAAPPDVLAHECSANHECDFSSCTERENYECLPNGGGGPGICNSGVGDCET